MRRVRYLVAASLDGYIAGPNGEADWIVPDPEIDFLAIFAEFDTLLIGRRTYEAMRQAGHGSMPGKKLVVFSRTIRKADHPDIEVVAENCAGYVDSLRQSPGKDLWLFGGGALFRSFIEAGLVDTVEVALIPVLLGEGIPLLPSFGRRTPQRLNGNQVYSTTGIVSLQYSIVRQ
jgi:dihydrofolate reductase